MNPYVTGTVIRTLRESRRMTQAELAERLAVSDKAVSRWETGRGYPDISLLEPLAGVFGVSVTELISGNTVSNCNVAANILRTGFYVCPVCGNILTATGQAVITCHGIPLEPLEEEAPDEAHAIRVETVEDEYYVSLQHPMTREHHISFLAALTSDRVQLHKLYPEGDAACRFRINGVRRLLCFCNRHGLFALSLQGRHTR